MHFCTSYLVELQTHPHARRYHLLQQVHVCKHPLVLAGDAEVTFEQGVKPVQKRLQAGGDRGREREKWRERERESTLAFQHSGWILLQFQLDNNKAYS